jgi:hypothetical protein
MSAITPATTSAALADGGETGRPLPRHPSAPGQSLTAEEFIAHVLHRAHHTARTSEEPGEARTVLRVAHLFADELAAIGRRFDRARFIEAVTREPA